VEDTPPSRTAVELLVGVGAYYEGDHARAVLHLRRGLAIEEESTDDVFAEQPHWLAFPARAAVFLGDEQAILRSTRRSATQARAAGRLGVLVNVLHRLGYAELWAGRWASASATAGEGLQLARELDQPHVVALQLALVALIAAHRGDEDDCRRAVAESRAVAPTGGLGFAAEVADWALTLLELGLGRPAEAFRRAREIARTFAVVWAALDRIEAAVRADERETARSWLASFEPWAVSCGAPWARGVMLHCRALLADDMTEAVQLFAEALDAHGHGARPFERARTELAFGELLRRSRRRVEAREHLHAALDGFETLGATVWAERAKTELRASGQTARRRDPSTRDELSPQEMQIARFVAQGLSNREVAAQLFLSPRTIDFHLRNVFRKLDITSRTQLARLALD
jgi:DNA-binding CsgD family transcriptional regulator